MRRLPFGANKASSGKFQTGSIEKLTRLRGFLPEKLENAFTRSLERIPSEKLGESFSEELGKVYSREAGRGWRDFQLGRLLPGMLEKASSRDGRKRFNQGCLKRLGKDSLRSLDRYL